MVQVVRVRLCGSKERSSSGREDAGRMSINRWATRTDKTQAICIEAARSIGWHVWQIRRPVDLLCWHPSGIWQPLECKTPSKSGAVRIRKEQAAQNAFCSLTFTPRVSSAEETIDFLQRRLTGAR